MSVPNAGFEVGLRSLRRLSSVAGFLMLLQGMLLVGILSSTADRVLVPVSVDFPGDTGERVELLPVDVGLAVVVLCVLVAAARLGAVIPAGFTRLSGRLRSNDHAARWTEFAFTSSITVFLVAQLNGISDIGALVAIYALTSGMTLFSVLQERTTVRSGHPLLPLAFGAAVGIVPWGVIAFHQVGAGVVGEGPSVIVRVITLAMLAAAFAFAVTQWRDSRSALRGTHGVGGERMHVVLSVVQASLFAWLVVLGVVLPAGPG
ncbi:heliorhodopsin HeR [Marisediminicola antarctica]|uniref:Uncharacterized protein n=1 Tax=Marisediminicola antarctica TaxID=674079 RepID=A0A7L5AGA7_9MICO|nr:heliorhodopsin HeR [Marisediminicola antarctica]QHO69257.1 hypothetical protein BHD05_05945 [Marisediminicola antarctica]